MLGQVPSSALPRKKVPSDTENLPSIYKEVLKVVDLLFQEKIAEIESNELEAALVLSLPSNIEGNILAENLK